MADKKDNEPPSITVTDISIGGDPEKDPPKGQDPTDPKAPPPTPTDAASCMEVTVRNIMEHKTADDATKGRLTVSVPKSATVLQLKQAIHKSTEIPPDSQTIVYNQQLMDDDTKPLSDYGVMHESTVDLTPKMTTGSAPAKSDELGSGTTCSISVVSLEFLFGGAPSKKVAPDAGKSDDKRTDAQKQAEKDKMKGKMSMIRKQRSATKKRRNGGSETTSPSSSNGTVTPDSDEDDSMRDMPTLAAAGQLTMLEQSRYFDAAESHQEMMEKTRKFFDPCESLADLQALRTRRYRNCCAVCRAKLTIIDKAINCRCEKKHCVKHRTPETHNCSFDYKNTGKQKIELENPKVIANKHGKDADEAKSPPAKPKPKGDTNNSS